MGANNYWRGRYNEYLQTPEWKQKRIEKFAQVGYNCQLCNSQDQLQVHHRTYQNLGNEDLNDLTVLCSKCHSHHHDKTSNLEDEIRRECIYNLKLEMAYYFTKSRIARDKELVAIRQLEAEQPEGYLDLIKQTRDECKKSLNIYHRQRSIIKTKILRWVIDFDEDEITEMSNKSYARLKGQEQ